MCKCDTAYDGSCRQGNMASKLANFLINMKLWECVPMMILFKISGGDFFVIDRKFINYA